MMGINFGGRRGLREMILITLRSGEKNGAEIIDSIEGVTAGMWRPSPGSVYPMLEKMVEEGLIEKTENGKYKRKEGREDLFGIFNRRGLFSGAPRSTEEAIEEIKSLIMYLEDIKSSGSRKVVEKSKELIDLAERLRKLTESNNK
ncbi:PadR family transcriptional regulator [Caldiplasma sukawensis]